MPDRAVLTPTIAEVLGDRQATTVTRHIVALAIEGRLRPHIIDSETRHGLYRVMLNGEGREALFGALHISAKNGNVIRANLTHGNHGQEHRYEYVADIRRVLASWVAVNRPSAGDPFAGMPNADDSWNTPV